MVKRLVVNEGEKKALELAIDAREALLDATSRKWDKEKPRTRDTFEWTVKSLDEVFDDHQDLISYGKAALLITQGIEHDLKKSIGSPASGEAERDTTELMVNASMYFAMMKIKADILDRYEINPSVEPKARKASDIDDKLSDKQLRNVLEALVNQTIDHAAYMFVSLRNKDEIDAVDLARLSDEDVIQAINKIKKLGVK